MTQERALIPALPIPVLRTTDLARLVRWYVGVLGLSVAQRVPGVVALLRSGALQLQLWQVPSTCAQECCVLFDGRADTVFDCHARLARSARAWIAGAPAIQPWGAWEFDLKDIAGNRVRFVQWASSPVQENVKPPMSGWPPRGRRDWMDK